MFSRKSFAVTLLICGASQAAQVTSSRDPDLLAYQARAQSVTGQITTLKNGSPWALNTGDAIPIGSLIVTGVDGYAHFTISGGSSFDVFSNSRVVFRSNTATPGDLVDVIAGRVRIHMQPVLGQVQPRVFTPIATISTHEPSTIAIAIDEDASMRVDVMEGEIRVQHKLLPNSEPVEVKAIDAIMVHQDEPISHRVDRGSLYRYTMRSLHDLWSAITPGHSTGRFNSADQLLARR